MMLVNHTWECPLLCRMILVLLNFANLIRENLYLSICICIYLVKLFLFECLLAICFLFFLWIVASFHTSLYLQSASLNWTQFHANSSGNSLPNYFHKLYAIFISSQPPSLIWLDMIYLFQIILGTTLYSSLCLLVGKEIDVIKNSIPKAKHHPLLHQWASKKKSLSKRTSLDVQWLRLCASNAKGMGLIPCRN